jgi:hypothetical protein
VSLGLLTLQEFKTLEAFLVRGYVKLLEFFSYARGGIINHSQGASDSGKDVSDSGQDVSDSGGGNEVSWIISKFFYICEIK